MTLQLPHFDTRLRRDLDIESKIDNTLAEYLFPGTDFALGMVYSEGTYSADLREYEGKTLQFASEDRMYFATEPVRDLLYPNPSDGAAYGSLVFTPNQQFSELRNVRILVVDDSVENLGQNGGIIPTEQAKNLIGDCHGKISTELAHELTDRKDTPFQFRLGLKPQEGNDVYRIGKGTLAPVNLKNLGQPLLKKLKNGEMLPKVGYDLVLPTSSFKGRKGDIAIMTGEYNLTIGLGIKALAKYGQHSLGTQVLVNYPLGVESDILPELKQKAERLAIVQSDPLKLAQLYVEKYERRQQLNKPTSADASTEVVVVAVADLDALNLAVDEAFGDEEIEDIEQQQQDLLLYRLLKGDLEGHLQVLDHPKIVDSLNKFVRNEWVDIATGRAIKFKSGLAQPSWELGLNEICVPSLPDGEEVIVTRSPLVNSNGVIVLTNRHRPEMENQQGTVHIHPETAADHLQADFDGDLLAFELASLYPTLAAEVKEYNLPENRYPNVVKANKIVYSGSFEEIALSARENQIGLIANLLQHAVALQWETQLIPIEKQPEYLNQISNHYIRLLKSDANPNKSLQLPTQFKSRVKHIANLPKKLSSEEITQALGSVKQILFDVTSELSNELQVAVDGPKSAARPNPAVLEYAKALSGYTPVSWLADKKNPSAFLDRPMSSNNYSPVDLMVQQATKKFEQSHLIARPLVQFRPMFQGIGFESKQETEAREITLAYNQLIKEAIDLDKTAKKGEGPTLIATSLASGKQIQITNLLKYAPPDSPVWSDSILDIKLYENDDNTLPRDEFWDKTDSPRLGYLSAPVERHVVKGCPSYPEKLLPNTLKAVLVTGSKENPTYQTIGVVSESSVKQHNLKPGIRIEQASNTLTSGATSNQVEAKFKSAAQYLEDVRNRTAEQSQLPLAAAIWHVNHPRNDDVDSLKKSGVAFNAFPELVVKQLSDLQFTNLKVVGVHQPSNELHGRKWNSEKVLGAIALETNPSSPIYGRRIVTVSGKKLAPLSSESPTLPVGTQFEAEIVSVPGAIVATTPKGNSLKIIKNSEHDLASSEWNGESTRIEIGFIPNPHSAQSGTLDPMLPVAKVGDKVLGEFDSESIKKLTAAKALKPGFNLTASLQTTPGTTAHIKVDAQSLIYPYQQQIQARNPTLDPTLIPLEPNQSSVGNISQSPHIQANGQKESLNQSTEPKELVDSQVTRTQGTDTSSQENIPELEQSLKQSDSESSAVFSQWPTANKLPTPENWMSVAKAIGRRPAYLNRVWQVVDEYIADGIPLPAQAVAAMSQDFATWQETNTSLRAWSEAALALGKPIEYLNDITKVVRDFNLDLKP